MAIGKARADEDTRIRKERGISQATVMEPGVFWVPDNTQYMT